MSSPAGVYTGIWTNQSKGPILGSTLTVTPDSGLLVVAVLALFVSLAGSQSWGILCFFIHQLRTTREPQFGMHYQQQVVLRNTGVASRTIWQLGKIAWAWRSHGLKSFRRSVGLVLMGVLHLLFFTAAGIFVSRLARVDNEILVRSKNCGLWNSSGLNLITDFVELSDSTVYERTTADASRDYVRQCLGQYESSPECNIFKRQNVTFQTSTNSSCPFDASMCSGPGGLAAKFDTGFLDSRDDLGFNSKQADRVQYRKVMTCSPITSDGYSSNGSAYYLGRGYNYTAEFYGVNNLMPSHIPQFGGIPNATYVHSDFKALELGYDAQIADSPYQVAYAIAYELFPEAGFSPIPELFSANGSTALVFASYTGIYSEPSDDPWLSAHQPKNMLFAIDGGAYQNRTFYKFDRTVSTLGCIEQHQVCNPNRAEDSSLRCTPLGGYDFLNNNPPLLARVFDTDHQLETAKLSIHSVATAELRILLAILSSVLLASNYLSSGMSTPLPPNQWILEAENWFATGVNIIQRVVSAIATGPPGYEQYTSSGAVNNTEIQWFCDNYIMRSNSYTSFSVLALGLVIGFGGFIIAVSSFLETIVAWLLRRWNRGKYHSVHWRLDSALQLQRMAFEEAGLGSWNRCTHEVPVTGEKIQIATEWDDWHPSIRGKQVVEKNSHQEVKGGEIVVSEVASQVLTVVTTESNSQFSVTEQEILVVTESPGEEDQVSEHD